jgi:hypothetical protein
MLFSSVTKTYGILVTFGKLQGYLLQLSSSGHTLPDTAQFAALSCTLCTLHCFQALIMNDSIAGI